MTPPGPKVLLAALPEDSSGLPAWARADLERVRTEPPTTRRATVPPPPPVTLLSPDPGNRAILETAPEFVWASVEGAEVYVVRLMTDPSDPDQEPREAGRAEAREPRHRFATRLEPGERYVLSIRSVQPDTEAWDAQERETVYRLEVLVEAETRQARWALQNVERYPVTAAMTMYRLGLYREAAETARHWPKDRRWQGWAAAIRTSCEDRLADPGR